MMIRCISLLFCYLVANNLNAEVFDPFYLTTNRDYINRLAWVEKQKQPLFYIELSDELKIEAVILLAQKHKIFLEVNMAKMIRKKFMKKGEAKFYYFLQAKDYQEIKLDKNQPLKFEWTVLPASHIHATSAPLTYAIKTRTDIYWLSEKQELELKRLKDIGTKWLKINLSAISAQNPYRKIPEKEVFMAVNQT